MPANPFDLILARVRSGFRQRTDYTCGPASLALAAEALGLGAIDEAEWLAPRFSHWLNLVEFPTRGISLSELLTVAELTLKSRATVSLERAHPERQGRFLEDVALAARGEAVLILNFVQDQLTGEQSGGQGNPHYSPLAGYRPQTSELLIADVDSEIPEPYWASVDQVFSAMGTINPIFQLPRGWLVLRARARARA